METLEAYLARKHEELKLLNGFLGTPLVLRHPLSVVEVIEQKFQLAAALKAMHCTIGRARRRPGQIRVGCAPAHTRDTLVCLKFTRFEFGT